MRIICNIMSIVEKVVGPLGRPPSAQAAKGLKAQSRGLQSYSTPVYKTQSETSIVPKPPNVPDKGPNSARRMSTNAGMKPVKTLEDVSTLLKNQAVKNVVVMAGAGISTPSGIPDFRTPGTGLYDNLQQYRIPYPEAIFDIDYFHHNPKPFFTLAKELYPSGKYRPNYIHYFLRNLYDKGMLLRMYTQNIDGLERLAGLPPDKLVEAHGTFASATCTICGSRKEGSEVKDAIFKDRLPKCLKRGCPGIVKPDIVFFGEDLPQRFYLYLRDMLQTDLVIVMGTSLEVQPFAGIIDTVKYGVPRVLFNWNAVGPFRAGKRAQDVVAAGDLISSLQKFAEMTGWKTEVDELIISNEGSLRICCPEYAKRAANRPKTMPKKPAPITNAFWRNRQESSSEEESSESESDSSSDSSDGDTRYKHESFRRRGVRSTGSMKNNMGTAQIKNGQNRLLNDVKKNGLNGNGQKRDFTTKGPNSQSPAPNSSFNTKNINGRNSSMNTRPPSGRIGKISSANLPSTEEKVRAPLEKLAPLSLKNKVDKNNSNDNKIIGSNSAKIIGSNSNTSEVMKSPSFNNDLNTVKNSINGKVNTNSSVSTVNNANTFNLKDTAVPSLDRKITTNNKKNEDRESVDKNLNTTRDIMNHNDSVLGILSNDDAKGDNSVVETNSGNYLNNNQDDNSKIGKNFKSFVSAESSDKELSSTKIVDNIKEGIEKLNLKPAVDSKTGVQNVVKEVISSKVKSPLPSDLLLSTRSEPAFSNIRTIKPENSKQKIEKIKTVKSDSAIGSNVKAETKTTLEKKTEKFKRSKSEKNLRKKEKEKRRSVSAKAKVNLKLIHNRYAKTVKSASPQTTITEKDEMLANTPKDDIKDEPYINLIGTLKRERPLDISLNMVNITCETPEQGNTESGSSSASKCECPKNDTMEKLNEQLSDLSTKSMLPEESQMCSDSEKSTEGRRKKRLFKKPPKHKKKFDNASKDLTSTLNPVPYGYASPRYKRLTGRAIIPPNVCGTYELPSEFSPQLLQKLGSGNVKLSYRHSLRSSPAVRSKVIVREDSANSEIVDKTVDTGIC